MPTPLPTANPTLLPLVTVNIGLETSLSPTMVLDVCLEAAETCSKASKTCSDSSSANYIYIIGGFVLGCIAVFLGLTCWGVHWTNSCCFASKRIDKAEEKLDEVAEVVEMQSACLGWNPLEIFLVFIFTYCLLCPLFISFVFFIFLFHINFPIPIPPTTITMVAT